MAKLQVLLFAGLSEACGRDHIELEVEAPMTVAALRADCLRTQPALQGQTFRVAVDSVYVEEDALVSADSEVAFIPPVSGG